MKEATGELNMTVITVVAIAAIAAFFYAFVWPQLKTSLQLTQACNSGPNYSDGTVTCGDTETDGTFTCSVGTKTKKCKPA